MYIEYIDTAKKFLKIHKYQMKWRPKHGKDRKIQSGNYSLIGSGIITSYYLCGSREICVSPTVKLKAILKIIFSSIFEKMAVSAL